MSYAPPIQAAPAPCTPPPPSPGRRELEVPLALLSPNVRMGWKAKHGIKKRQQKAIAGALLTLGSWRPTLPCVVTFVRVCWQPYDDDNLRLTLKAVRDCVAKWLGTHDGKRAPVRWEYDQEIRRKVKGYEAVRIIIESVKGDG